MEKRSSDHDTENQTERRKTILCPVCGKPLQSSLLMCDDCSQKSIAQTEEFKREARSLDRSSRNTKTDDSFYELFSRTLFDGRDEYKATNIRYGINTALGVPMELMYSSSAFNNGSGTSVYRDITSFYELVAWAKRVSEDTYNRLSGIDESNWEKYVYADFNTKLLCDNEDEWLVEPADVPALKELMIVGACNRFFIGVRDGKPHFLRIINGKMILYSKESVNSTSEELHLTYRVYRTTINYTNLSEIWRYRLTAVYHGNEYNVLNIHPNLEAVLLELRTDHYAEDKALGFDFNIKDGMGDKLVLPDELDSLFVHKRILYRKDK